QAPDQAAVKRAAEEAAQKQRHEAVTGPPRQRPDPQRIVSPRPQRATVSEPHRIKAPKKSRAPVILGVATATLLVAFGAWYFVAGPGRGGNIAVTVTVEPAGAEVWDGDRLVGPAPTVVKIARNAEPHTLYIKKNGFLTAQRVVQTKDDQALKLRLTAKPRPEGEGGEDGAAPPEAATPKPTPPPMPVAVTPPPKTVAPAPPPKSVQMADK